MVDEEVTITLTGSNFRHEDTEVRLLTFYFSFICHLQSFDLSFRQTLSYFFASNNGDGRYGINEIPGPGCGPEPPSPTPTPYPNPVPTPIPFPTPTPTPFPTPTPTPPHTPLVLHFTQKVVGAFGVRWDYDVLLGSASYSDLSNFEFYVALIICPTYQKNSNQVFPNLSFRLFGGF